MLQTFPARLAMVVVAREIGASWTTSAFAWLTLPFPDRWWIRNAIALVVPAAVARVMKRILYQ
jgi:hypothetical protein